jgi:hypothetical protein
MYKSKLMSEVPIKKKEEIAILLKEAGFRVNPKIDKKITFSSGFREFNLYSTDVVDTEFGLTTSINLDKFLKENYKEKTKHTISLRELIHNQEKSVEDACDKLEWEITDCKHLKDFEVDDETEEPLAEIIYQINIRDLAHIIIDDEVFEGELGPLMALISVNNIEAFKQMAGESLLNKIIKL